MKFILWKGKTNNRYLHIYAKIYSNKMIIPIGSDCHSAYILNGLKLRKKSLIFDWLFSNSKTAIEYVNSNIKNNFEFFLQDLTINHRNHIISNHYPQTEFFHEKNLINSTDDQKKVQKRADRFISTINQNKCYLLYVINPEHFENEEDIDYFTSSIRELIQITNDRHQICIFIKCKQNIVDFTLIDKLLKSCNDIPNVKAVKYHLNTDKYGQWGNPKDFLPLLKSLDIIIHKSIIPEIFIK